MENILKYFNMTRLAYIINVQNHTHLFKSYENQCCQLFFLYISYFGPLKIHVVKYVPRFM